MLSGTHSTSRLRARDILQSLGLGVFASVIFSNSLLHNAVVLIPLASLVLYFTIVFMPRRYGYLATLSFGVSCALLLKGEIDSEMMRLVLFSLLISSQRKEPEILPPFVLLSVLWIIHLLAAIYAPGILTESARHYLPKISFQNVFTLSVEISGMLIFGLLRCVKHPYSALGQVQELLTTKTFFIHLIALPLLILAVISYFTTQTSGIATLGNLNSEAQISGLILILGASLLLICLYGGFSATLFRQIFQTLGELTNGDTRILHEMRRYLPLLEFRQTQTEVLRAAKELRNAKRVLKALTLEVAALKEQTKDAEKHLERLEYLIYNSPLALAAVQLNGTIVSHNNTFAELLAHKETSLAGKPYSSILSTSDTWEVDISDAFSWAIWRFKDLQQGGPKRRCSREKHGDYLEITLFARVSKSFAEQQLTSSSILPLPHEALIIATIRRIPDLRKFQIRALSPSALEMLGSDTARVCSSQLESLSNIVECTTHAAKAISAKKSEAGAASQPLLNELGSFLIEIDDLARTSAAELIALEKKVDPAKEVPEPVNLSRLLTQVLGYFYALTTRDTPPEICVRNDLVKLHEDDPTDHIPMVKSEHIEICCRGADLTRFLSYVLCLLHSILAKATDLAIEIDYELIGEGTADIITGSLPGRYARVVLKHSGRSIAPYMISSEISELDPRKSPLEDVESALCFLRHQVRVMGGFLSIQSSTGRGTEITIYLPVEATPVDTLETPDLAEPDLPTECTTEEPPNLILVTESDDLLPRMQSIFRTLSYVPAQCSALQAKTALKLEESKHNPPSDAPGYGKDREERLLLNAVNKALMLKHKLQDPSVECVIFDVSSDDSELMEIAEELRLQTPTASHIVFISPDHFELMDFHAWQPLFKPLDFSSLEKILLRP